MTEAETLPSGTHGSIDQCMMSAVSQMNSSHLFVIPVPPAVNDPVSLTEEGDSLTIAWSQPAQTQGQLQHWLVQYTVDGILYNHTVPSSQSYLLLPDPLPFTYYNSITVSLSPSTAVMYIQVDCMIADYPAGKVQEQCRLFITVSIHQLSDEPVHPITTSGFDHLFVFKSLSRTLLAGARTH